MYTEDLLWPKGDTNFISSERLLSTQEKIFLSTRNSILLTLLTLLCKYLGLIWIKDDFKMHSKSSDCRLCATQKI